MSEQQIELIEIGCLLFMGIYHIILFYQVKKYYYLYLGLLSLIVLIRAMLVYDGSQFFFDLFPHVSAETGLKIEYFVVHSTLFLMPMYVIDLFQINGFRRYVRFLQIEGSVLMLVVVLTPYSFFVNTLNIYHLSMFVSFFLVFAALFKAMRRKYTGSFTVFYGLIICFVFVAAEMIKNSKLVTFEVAGPNLVNTGVVLYFFFQAVALSALFARSFRENERLNKQLEEKVDARTEMLSKSNLVKERFIRIISHDLRSPLGTLKTAVALVKDGTIPEEQVPSLFRKIDDNIDGAIKMLDDLLEWTKSTSGPKLVTQKEEILIGNLISETLQFCSVLAESKNIELINETKKLNAIAVCDKNAIKVVLRNLVCNAIKFTPPNGSVTVSFEKLQNLVEVSVKDTGIGIPDKMKKTLFEMDVNNKRMGTNNEKTTGIGLALCKDLVYQNGGKIWVVNNPAGKGSIFKFDLKSASVGKIIKRILVK